MHEERDGLEKKLKQEAAGWSVQPSAEVWSGIQSQLPRRRRRGFWWAAAAVLLLGGAYLWYPHAETPAPAALSGEATPAEKHPPSSLQPVVPPASPSASGSSQSTASTPPTPSAASPVYSSSRTNGSGIRATEGAGGAGQAPRVPAPSPADKAVPAGKSGEPMTAPSLAPGTPLVPLTGALALQASPLQPGPAQAAPVGASFLPPVSAAAGVQPSDAWPAPAALPPRAAVRRLHWEAYVTPALSYRHWRHQARLPSGSSSDYAAAPSNNNPGYTATPLDTPHLSHQPVAGWNAGVQAAWSIGPRLSLLGGLRVSSMGYQIKAYRSFQAYVQGNRGPAFAPAAAANSQFTALARAAPPADQKNPRILHNHYFYAQVPLLLRMEYGQGAGLRFFSSAGAGLSLLWDAHANIYAPESGRYFTDPDKLRTVNADLYFQAGVTAPLGRSLRLQLGPSFQYQLFSTYRKYPQVREYPWQLGLRLGLQWPR